MSVLLIVGGIVAVAIFSELVYRSFRSKADTLSHGSGVIVGIAWLAISVAIMLGGGIGFVIGAFLFFLYWLMWRPDVHAVGLEGRIRQKLNG